MTNYLTSTGETATTERTEAERLVDALGLTRGVSIDEIVARIARLYEKALVLQPIDDDELTATTGLWVETDDTGYVFYRAQDPLVYQIHSIFHEFGHIMAEHDGCDALGVVDGAAFESIRLGEQICRARGRGAFVHESEILAEDFAYALSRLVLSSASVGLRAAFE